MTINFSEAVEVELDGQVSTKVVSREQWVEVSEVGPQGPPGPQGPAGGDSASIQHTQSVPSSSWSINVPLLLGRTPSVAVYVDGKLVAADVEANASTVNIVFPSPVAGLAILT